MIGGEAHAWLTALLFAIPWAIGPALVAWRLSDSRSLDEEASDPPADAPLVSIVIPARDEARNIARCVVSLLASAYPRIEIVVVDDHSSDGMAAAALVASAGDERLRVVMNPALPDGWFGKQWACATGADHTRGEIILFVDADTRSAPDLVTRMVNAMHARGAALLSVGGTQELGSFWERAVQPQMFALIGARYGGTERVNRSRRIEDKIANGQCLMVRRVAYDDVGGHAAVRGSVAEDVMLAQHFFRRGHTVALVLGRAQISTRMYTSLRELAAGWGKNVYAGGRDAMPWGRAGRIAYPFLLPLPPLLNLAPVVALLLGLSGVVPLAVTLWGAFALIPVLLFWAVAYRSGGYSAANALLFPLGALVFLYIAVSASLRGSRVRWKGRDYRAR